jgi:hypothetical protein
MAVPKKKGFVPAYKAALGYILYTDWNDCPASFDVIEQVVLARNRAQHGSSLTSFEVAHEGKTLTKYPRPLFATARELQAWEAYGGDRNSLFLPAMEAWPWRINAAGACWTGIIGDFEDLPTRRCKSNCIPDLSFRE